MRNLVDYPAGAVLWLSYPASRYFWPVVVIGLVAVIVVLLKV